MAKSLQLKCPKCAGKSSSRVECSNCGLIFARYTIFQARVRVAKAARDASTRRLANLAMNVLIFAVIAGVGFYFFNNQKPEPQIAQNTPKPTQQKAVSKQPAKAVSTTNTQKSTGTTTGTSSRRNNTFETAKQSIVTIETPWGRAGFGFFIEEDKVITSKYLVEYNEKRQQEYTKTVERTRRFIEQETNDLLELENSYNQSAEGPAKSELAAEIDTRKKRLSNLSLRQNKREDRLAERSNNHSTLQIKLYSSDGSELQVSSADLSRTHDLALLYVYDGDVQYIERPPEEITLKEGDTVYSLGAKSKGIKASFSQYHQSDNPANNYLQTNTAISIEYSGSPLIDKQGYVHGVSTTALINENGIGSAIPLDVVLSEFFL